MRCEKIKDGKSGLTGNAKAKYVFITVMLAYPMLNFLVFYVLVNANSLLLAFQKIDADMNYSVAGIQNFIDVFKGFSFDETFLISIKNTLIMFIATFVIGFPLNILFSYFLHKKVLGSGAIRVSLMVPTMISGIIVALLFMKFIENAIPSIISKFFGKDMPNLITNVKYAFNTMIFFTLWTGFSSSVIIYSNAMNGISPEVFESAKIDGATNLQEILFIIVPLIYPTITTYLITGVAGLFSNTGPLYIFYNETAPKEAYMTGYYMLVKTIGRSTTIRDYPFASAVGLLFTAISVPITLMVKWVLEKRDPSVD